VVPRPQQHPNGVDNVKQVVNLLCSVGTSPARSGPVRVPATAMCRAIARWASGSAPRAVPRRTRREMGIRSPRESGVDAVEALHALHDGSAKVFFAISGNLFSAAPDTHFTAEAFGRCPARRARVDQTAPRSPPWRQGSDHLPCLGRAERMLLGGKLQISSAEDSMGIVNPTRGREEPIAEDLLSDTEILVRVAQATFGDESPVDWGSLLDHDRVARSHRAG